MAEAVEPVFGCVEAGGTKFVAGLVAADRRILHRHRVQTTDPVSTIGATIAWLREGLGGRAPAAIGIASFGPLVLAPGAADRGHIADTPKPGWSGAAMVRPFGDAFACPLGFDTDVNAAAIAEHRWGAARGCAVAAYVTIGTGIGGGLVVDGRPVHGARHPEMGHMIPRRHPDDRQFAGTCPFHGDCLEGLASGPAVAARWGASLSHLSPDHPAHGIVAWYLAQLVVAQQALFAPERIVLGGGVMATPGLLGRVRAEAVGIGAGYFGSGDPERLIVAPGLGDDAGLLGALALAQDAGDAARG